MAKTDLSEAANRGQKRLRTDNLCNESNPAPEVSRKRRRLDDDVDRPTTIVGRVRNILAGVWDYFWGKSSRVDPDDTMDPVDDEVRYCFESFETS